MGRERAQIGSVPIQKSGRWNILTRDASAKSSAKSGGLRGFPGTNVL